MLNRSNTFPTGNKDVDRTILEKLSDRDILIACQTNYYTQKKICDETFFRNLVYSRYTGTIKYKDYVKIRNWKNFYLSVIYYMDKLYKEYNFVYSEENIKEKDISPELEYLSRKISDPFFSLESRLIAASKNGHLPVVKYLVEKGVSVNIEDDLALAYASRNGHLETVKYLVKHGANIHADNERALIFTIDVGHFEIIKYLVKHGADIHINDDYPIKLANRYGRVKIFNYLKSLSK